MSIIKIRYLDRTETNTEIIRKCKVGFFDRRYKENTRWTDGIDIINKETHKITILTNNNKN